MKWLVCLFKSKNLDQKAQQQTRYLINWAYATCAYVCFRGPLSSTKGLVMPVLIHPCALVWWLCVWLAYVSGLLGPSLLPRESPSTLSLHPPAGAALWDRRQPDPRLSHSGLAPFHSPNKANYISNGNR